MATLGVPDGAPSLMRPLGRVELRCDDDDRRRQLVEALEAAGIDVGGEPAVPADVRRVA